MFKKIGILFFIGSSKPNCVPFFIEEKQAGIIRPDILPHLQKYSDVFIISPSGVKLSDDLKTPKERSDKVEDVLKDLKKQNVLKQLNGWRNEVSITVKVIDNKSQEIKSCLIHFI